MWLISLEAERWHCPPSELLGLKSGSYEAYCFNEAVGYVASFIRGKLEEAGHKPGKEERRIAAARERVLRKYLPETPGKEEKPQFADPAMLFS